MLRCLVVDDEDYARKGLISLLRHFEEVEVVGEASNGYEAISKNKELAPDLIFLDIRMPQMSGLEVADIIMKEKGRTVIVFTTAYDEFAIKAFEVNAVDYLLKPISRSRLGQTIEKILRLNKEENQWHIKEIEEIVRELRKDEGYKSTKIYINEKDKIIVLNHSDIVYISSLDGYAYIITTKGNFKSRITLNSLEEQLNYPNFFRVHRSYLVNLDFIESIIPWYNATYALELTGVKEKIPVSRSKLNEFKDIMKI
ncbi:LytR/AlgR family response regulator transcription factor [Tissierella carlieri]|jgi:DNA-binding LytR/AlgR family response regulator|uniref:LytR/AlgR family response regulator transcription factor n=1 Tax=Tissierella carlieri TaxID=689904 RepID=UPI0028064457|nr:LytTR family DNA-binding domain-containing protein [uncultured Tissierella sp.]MDU5082681.1 LytTR family DNA-binding domain-containing protein [Bacillota bacterium]